MKLQHGTVQRRQSQRHSGLLATLPALCGSSHSHPILVYTTGFAVFCILVLLCIVFCIICVLCLPYIVGWVF